MVEPPEYYAGAASVVVGEVAVQGLQGVGLAGPDHAEFFDEVLALLGHAEHLAQGGEFGVAEGAIPGKVVHELA
jgi:hypothetical protein